MAFHLAKKNKAILHYLMNKNLKKNESFNNNFKNHN